MTTTSPATSATPAADAPALPPGWAWTMLGITCSKIQYGTHFSPKSQYDEPGSARYKYITAKNIKEYGFDLSELTYVDKDVHRAIFNRCNPEFEDVLLIKDGVTTGVATVNRLREEFTLLSSVALLKPLREVLDPYYLRHYLNSPTGFATITGQMTGTAIKRIILEKIRTAPIPLPPLAEQRRIVAAIETQLTRLDAGVASLRAAQAKLRRYRAAVLKAACEGRLVAQDLSDEPADALLRRVVGNREQGQGSAGIEGGHKARPDAAQHSESQRAQRVGAPLVGALNANNDLPELPQGWVWTTWEDLSPRVTVGFVGPMKHEYVESGIPFLRSQNVRQNRYDPDGLCFISPSFHQRIAKSTIHPGDLLVVRSGSVGITCVVPDTLPEANCSDLVIIQKPVGLESLFGSYYMNSQARSLIKAGQAGIALTHFNTKSVAALPVPLPPLAEQRRIVAEVERRLSVVSALEATVAANLRRAERLRQSILKRAFAGKLVPQDVSDEPASALLERARAGGRRQEASAGDRGRARAQRGRPGDRCRRTSRCAGRRNWGWRGWSKQCHLTNSLSPSSSIKSRTQAPSPPRRCLVSTRSIAMAR